MARLSERWFLRPQIWIEAFAILNVGFLTFDIYLAHSVNQFRNQAEYIPLIFSATAPLFLIGGLTLGLSLARCMVRPWVSGWMGCHTRRSHRRDPSSRKPLLL